MSVLGTTVAAGVAQTTAQAQQVANERNGQAAPVARHPRRVREMAESRLRGLDEADEAELSAPQVDDQLANQQPPQQEAGDESPSRQTPDDTSEPKLADQTEHLLYRHLDLHA